MWILGLMEISLENLYVDTEAYGDQFGEFICGYWGLKG